MKIIILGVILLTSFTTSAESISLRRFNGYLPEIQLLLDTGDTIKKLYRNESEDQMLIRAGATVTAYEAKLTRQNPNLFVRCRLAEPMGTHFRIICFGALN